MAAERQDASLNPASEANWGDFSKRRCKTPRKLEVLMFNPKYRISLTKKCFPEDKVVCLGHQLISIVNALKDFLPKHMWYGANVDAVGKGAMRANVNDIQLSLVGTDFEFIQYCAEIDQFIWGFFVCMDNRFLAQSIEGVELGTEDPAFRSIDCNGILLEMRTFDASYFEIYSEEKEIINIISKKFNFSDKEVKIR